MADRFEDARGVIEDLLCEPLDAVTRITTKRGAVRGNHVHDQTTQWTYIVAGVLLIVTDDPVKGRREERYGPGELAREEPGIPHAWRAETDVTCLVFTRGPRSGEAYESDTRRLKDPLL